MHHFAGQFAFGLAWIPIRALYLLISGKGGVFRCTMLKLCCVLATLCVAYSGPLWDIPDVGDVLLPRFAKKLLEKQRLEDMHSTSTPLATDDLGMLILDSPYNLPGPLPDVANPTELPLPLLEVSQVEVDPLESSGFPPVLGLPAEVGIHQEFPTIPTTTLGSIPVVKESPSLKVLARNNLSTEASLSHLSDVAAAVFNSPSALTLAALLAVGIYLPAFSLW